MANPTRSRQGYAFIVANAQTINKRGLVGIESSNGYVYPWADDATYVLAGIAEDTVVGDGTVTVAVDMTGPILENLAVTGATSIAAVGNAVYASGPATYTMTPTTHALPVGVVVRYRSSGIADVLIQTLKEYKDMLIAKAWA